ncbi:MAG: parvulin peptidyl-prolyl isomerase [Desulfobacterales bacterium]|nr:MAG: parvulin peptidyl-prolyl isomerase [Desulfobacterales bacterium]
MIDRIVAIVNNDIITLVDLNYATRSYRQKIMASQNSDIQKKELIANIEKDLLGQLVEQSLADQECEKFGIKVTDADIEAAIENFKQLNKLDDARLEQELAAEGLTLADYKLKLKSQIRQSRLVNQAVSSKIVITEKEVRQYYDAHIDQFQGGTKYKLRNILTRDREQMDEVLEKIEAGVAFSELAKVYSIGSNAPEGGELGLFDLSSVSEHIRNVVQHLKKGEHTPVLEAGDSFQLIYVEDIVSEAESAFEKAREKIQNILYRAQGEALFKKWMRALKENAHIKIML